MSDIEVFIATPSQKALDVCTKEQFLILAEHYSVVVEGDRHLKENVKASIGSNLIEVGIMAEDYEDSSPGASALSFQTQGLTLEQQKGFFFLLWVEREKIKKNKRVRSLMNSLKWKESAHIVRATGCPLYVSVGYRRWYVVQ